MFARTAMFATPPGQGTALAYYSASGGPSANDCLPTTDPIPWSSENWTPELSPELVKGKYRPTWPEIVHIRNEMDRFYEDQVINTSIYITNPPFILMVIYYFIILLLFLRLHLSQGWAAGRFIAPLGRWYDNTSPHGFSVWANSNKCYDQYRNRSFSCSAYGAKGACLDKGGGHFWTKEVRILVYITCLIAIRNS
jgi:hypothetical protein